MASVKRIPTGYKGVFYVERKGEKILCIFYRKPGDRKQSEEKLGTSAQGWTPARANAERTNRINGQKLTNNERRQAQAEAKRNAESRPTIERLWQLYLELPSASIHWLDRLKALRSTEAGLERC